MSTRNINAMRMLLAPLKRKLQLMFTRGSVLRSDDAGDVQTLQVSGLKGETHDNVPRYQQYGFTSRPKQGAKALLLQLFGSRSKLLALLVEDGRFRVKQIAEGEVVMYSDEGDYIHFKRGRIVEVMAGARLQATAPEVVVNAATKVTFDTPLVEATQDFHVGGNITADGNVSDQKGSMEDMRTTYNNHNAHPPKDNGQGMN